MPVGHHVKLRRLLRAGAHEALKEFVTFAHWRHWDKQVRSAR
jgi:hypothetical protein